MTDLQYRYVALIDVLGYRYLLEKDRKLGKLDFKDKLTNALGVLEHFDESIIKVQAISDTIIISCEEHRHIIDFFDALRKIFIAFLREGLFIRGGVAYSRHYQNNHVTYSHAIARAYELEQQSAVYPRIVIDNNIIEMFKVGEDLPDILKSGIICNEQGVYFLQMLSEDTWEEIYKLASDIYEKDKSQLNENAYSKHLRFQNLLLDSEYNVRSVGPFIPKINSLL
ncbi:hypothetical protein C1I60_06110 [Paenibacillus terrae]|uniref:Guanylate cyclase domain-containing protein n=1 Tax=Paenibacillus terrae TaxID=159743 RepID=A0A4V5SQF1_9BACL|nr:hypothetical protein [Paenibacillus terrae]TKH46001.1 hypothetical protein C1I60_06110 [Paenibacillus terrae]